MTEVELAWFAGLFEGEGSFRLGGRSQRMAITMTDKDIIKRVHTLTGGQMYGPYTREHKDGYPRKPTWQWVLSKRDEVKALIKQLVPYLGQRRYARALELLQYIEMRNGVKNANV